MGDQPSETKSFLYAWLGKNKIVPEYNVRAAGAKNRQRFLCELIIEGHNYTAVGNSTNKKDAQTNAAKDFVQYLLRSGHLKPEEVPEQVLAFTPTAAEPLSSGAGVPHVSRPVFPGGHAPEHYGDAYRTSQGHIPFNRPPMESFNVEDAEAADVNAGIHGNWSLDNAKSRLHQFLQMNRIKADYKYSSVGPEGARSFKAEMRIYVKQLGREVYAAETGSNKQTASKSCALSLVRQLYHLQVIEPFTGSLKRPKEADAPKPIEMNMDPELMSQVHEVLGELEIQPITVNPDNIKQVRRNDGANNKFPSNVTVKVEVDDTHYGGDAPQGDGNDSVCIPLIRENRKQPLMYNNSEDTSQLSIVSWSPPLPNWNPWTSCNIDEGHMASTGLDQLSDEFLQSFSEAQQTNKHIQQMLSKRNELPIFFKKSVIMEHIGEFPVILIKGDTGCGKTTQICQFIMDDYIVSGQGAYCNVVVTQPRRISAISVAERVANERGEDLGQSVGYSVRFESCLPRPYASILFCTVGVLLRKLESGLRGVSHVIVDEIHERDINTDFLLVVLRDMLSAYPDLRVILMSATIDDTLFTQYFNGCPVIQVEGRTFPVDTFFLEDVVEMLNFQPSPDSIRKAKKKRQEDDEELCVSEENLNILDPHSQYSQITKKTMAQLNERDVNLEMFSSLLSYIKSMNVPGSILVFLPGWNVIFTFLRYLQDHPVFGSQSYCVLPLHSQLPREDQHRVFKPVPDHVTKIILSTNIAETSITIDDVVFVIDSCKAKIKLFTSHNNMTTFATVWASKSSLLQRRGRAGRVRHGYCYHLCSNKRFEALDENMAPEMLRTPLHEIALTIKLLRLGAIGHFLSKAPEPPPIDAVIEAEVLLTELNCLNEKSELTKLGRILAKLPVDPRLGKMIILGAIFSCADPLAVLAAQSSNLSEIFNLGPENKRLAPQQRGFAANRNSDHFAALNAFQQWNIQKSRRGEQGEIEFCSQRMLSLPSLRTTNDAKNQLLQVLGICGFPEEIISPFTLSFRGENPTLDTIAALLCSGLYPNVCYHKDKRKVLTMESKAALIHKASVNCSRFEITFPYPFFIFGEKIRTRAISCKQMTMIAPVHLLLFGARKVDYVDNMVHLDNWINLKMNPNDAAAITALRPAIENLVIKATEDPTGFFPLQHLDEKLVNLVVELCRMPGAYNERHNDGYNSNRGGGGFRNFNQGPNFSRFGGGDNSEMDNEEEPNEDVAESHSGDADQPDFDEGESSFSAGGAPEPRGVKRLADESFGPPEKIPRDDQGFGNRGRGFNRGYGGGGSYTRGSGGYSGGFNNSKGGSGGGFNNSRGSTGGFNNSRGSPGGFNSRGSTGGYNNPRGGFNSRDSTSSGSYSNSGGGFSQRGGFTPTGGNSYGMGGGGGSRYSSPHRGWSARGSSGVRPSRGGGSFNSPYKPPRHNYPY